MNDEPALLANWGFGLVGLTYLALAATLVRRGYLDAPRNRAQSLALLALLVQAAWGVLSLVSQFWDAAPFVCARAARRSIALRLLVCVFAVPAGACPGARCSG